MVNSSLFQNKLMMREAQAEFFGCGGFCTEPTLSQAPSLLQVSLPVTTARFLRKAGHKSLVNHSCQEQQCLKIQKQQLTELEGEQSFNNNGWNIQQPNFSNRYKN